MKQVFFRQGQVVVEDVPPPLVEPGAVLVAVDHSCISVGTELSGVRTSATPLWRRALARPRAVLKVLELAANQGVSHARQVVSGALSAAAPTGYSAAGTVVEVGDGIEDLRAGDRVACAGAQCAHHAEFICPPRNLTVPVPDSLDLAAASTVTLGAIALQGVRRAAPTLGETFVVIGLGLLGQLTCQMLKANGCRVIATDLDADRVALAESLGADNAFTPADGDGGEIARVARLTDGIGADGVIITAATKSDAVVSMAFGMCRKKGRVVVVGDVGLSLNRADIYAKELDFFISTSYGPGRYDRRYEEEGVDYPVGYVRWTENRNMAEYLRLVAEGRVRLGPLIGATHSVDEAPAAYAALRSGDGPRPLIVLLSYPQQNATTHPVLERSVTRRVANPRAAAGRPGAIRLGLIGAGSFAQGMHLPNLQSLREEFTLRAVCSRRGATAANVARQFGAAYFTSDAQEIFADPDIDAVLITTRHDSHARLALEALQAGKHVLLEKPLSLDEAGLQAIEAFYGTRAAAANAGPLGARAGGDALPVLLTGFNRRFSPHARRMRELVAGRTSPMILNYRMNAGYIPRDSWVHGPQGGGRNLGEACHIYDLFVFLTGSQVLDVSARAIRPASGHDSPTDNFVATVTFADGSLGTLTYTALGSTAYPKESLDVFVDGSVLTLSDYRETQVHGRKARGYAGRRVEKGHREELVEFARVVRLGGEWPISLAEQAEGTRIAFAVEEQLRPQATAQKLRRSA